MKRPWVHMSSPSRSPLPPPSPPAPPSSYNFSYSCTSLECDKAWRVESQKSFHLVLTLGCKQSKCKVLPEGRETEAFPSSPSNFLKRDLQVLEGVELKQLVLACPLFLDHQNKLEAASYRITAKIARDTRLPHKSTPEFCTSRQSLFYFTDEKIKP